MTDVDADDMTPGMQAFIYAFLGGGLITGGLIASIFFWPLGVLLFVAGALLMFGSPVIWFLRRRQETDDVDGAISQ